MKHEKCPMSFQLQLESRDSDLDALEALEALGEDYLNMVPQLVHASRRTLRTLRVKLT